MLETSSMYAPVIFLFATPPALQIGSRWDKSAADIASCRPAFGLSPDNRTRLAFSISDL